MISSKDCCKVRLLVKQHIADVALVFLARRNPDHRKIQRIFIKEDSQSTSKLVDLLLLYYFLLAIGVEAETAVASTWRLHCACPSATRWKKKNNGNEMCVRGAQEVACLCLALATFFSAICSGEKMKRTIVLGCKPHQRLAAKPAEVKMSDFVSGACLKVGCI